MAYCTLAEVKQYIDSDEVTDDALIEDLIDYAQKIIDDYCGRVFEASSDTTRKFSAVDDVEDAVLWLDEDLASITTITNGDGTTVTSSQYVTIPPNDAPYYGIRIRSDQSIAWTYSTYHENAISISGKWAFSTTAPNSVKHACIRLAAFLYRQRDSSSDFDRPVVVEGSITVLPGDLPRDVQLILRPYVKGMP